MAKAVIARDVLLERFNAKWRKDERTGCWIWFGSNKGNGYGEIWTGRNKECAHRVSYVLHVGPIPNGMQVDHFLMNRKETRDHCSRACVNPDHLEIVTSAENSSRSELKKETDRNNGKNNGRKMGLANRKNALPEGVSLARNGFRAQIWDRSSKKMRHIGLFDSPQLAHRAYLAAKGVRE